MRRAVYCLCGWLVQDAAGDAVGAFLVAFTKVMMIYWYLDLSKLVWHLILINRYEGLRKITKCCYISTIINNVPSFYIYL